MKANYRYNKPQKPSTQYIFKEIATRQNSEDYLYLNETLPNPDPILRKIGGRYEYYERIYDDPNVFPFVQNRQAGTLRLDWELLKLQAKDKEVKFIEEWLSTIKVRQITKDILDTVPYGITIFEMNWENIDGYNIPTSIVAKPRDWFTFNGENELRFLHKNHAYDGIECSKEKFVVSTQDASYTNPYGKPVLAKCFWEATFLRQSKKFWITFIEKYGMPHLIGKYIGALSDDDAQDFLDQLVNMRTDGALVLPSNFDVQVTDNQQTNSSGMYEAFIKDCRETIARTFLGHTGTSSSTSGKLGSETAAETVRDHLVLSDRTLVEDTWNEIIKIVLKANFNSGLFPYFSLYDPEDIKKSRVERDEKIYGMGFELTKEYMKKTYGFKEEHLAKTSVSNENPDKTQQETPEVKQDEKETEEELENPTKFSEFEAPDQGVIDKVAQMLENPTMQGKILEQLLEPLFAEAEKATDLGTLAENIHKVFPKMDNSQFENLITKLFVVSEQFGNNSSIQDGVD